MTKERADELDLLSAIADAGLTPRRAVDLAAEVDVPASTLSRWLKRLVASGWAEERNGGYVMGLALDRANRRLKEDAAAIAGRCREVLDRVDGPEQDQQAENERGVFFGLRMADELRKSMSAEVQQQFKSLRKDLLARERSFG